ncbi:MAG: aldose epimerase [bacterium]|nr:aldose epimerase [bacterium]
MYKIICSHSGAQAEFIPQLGGIVSSWQVEVAGQRRELLFRHEWFWDTATARVRGGIPFLFPICGRLERDGEQGTYLWNHTRYKLPIHGFALRMPWQVVEEGAQDTLTLALSDTEDTRAVYPFEFRVRLTWHIGPDRLVCTQVYENTGGEPLPYYAGFHPYFLTPETTEKKAHVYVRYTAQAKLAYNERYTDIIGSAPAPRCPISVCAGEINETLLAVPDGSAAQLLFPDGSVIEVSAHGLDSPHMFPYLQCYTMAEKPFFCIEPWMGFPNAMNTMYGVRWLAPRRCERARFECRFRAQERGEHGTA